MEATGKKISSLPELTDLTSSGKDVLVQTTTGLQRLDVEDTFDFLSDAKGLKRFSDSNGVKYDGKPIDGDMKLSEFVNSGGTGQVLSSKDSDKLGGHNDAHYAKQADVTALQSVSHTHSNKALLDTYSNANSDITDAISKKHEHSNKTLLDSYSNSNTDISNAISNSHSHSNKALLDTYSNSNSDISSAISNKHTHSNKGVIDKFSENSGKLQYNNNPVGGDSFTHVKVGSATLNADSNDTLEFVAGSNVTMQVDEASKQIVINSAGGSGGSGGGDMTKEEFVLSGGTGVVLAAQSLDGANNTVLKKFDLNSETGNLEYDGAPISGGHELITTKEDLEAVTHTGEKVVEAFLVKQLLHTTEEMVNVNVNADDSTSVDGLTVTLHDVTDEKTEDKTLSSGVATFYIEPEHEYYFSYESKDGYVAPDDSVHYTSVRENVRNVSAVYQLWTATIDVTFPSGSTCTCSKDSTVYTAENDENYTFSVHEAGEWVIQSTDGSQTSSTTVTITNHGDAETVTLAYFSATIITTYPTGATCTCSKDSTVLTAAQSPYAFSVAETGIWTISITDGTNTRTKDIEITTDGQTETVTMAFTTIYGVQWDGTSTTSWTRTDAAASFIDPVPYYSGMSGTPSSPFDELMPWSGMVESDRTGGRMVAIPKFWYKLEKSGNGLKIQIADGEVDGFKVSPAHIDRGDGAGERDVVYVGKYHCAASDYKSKTGEKPKVNITRSAARSSIHNLGTDIWQWDWLTRFTLFLLYLVEFANWNTQAKIGYGCGNNSAVENMGASDAFTYHTGTCKTSKTTYGVGVKYRNIEGLWDNCYDWVDGVYYNSNGMNIIKKPSDFSDSSNGTLIGKPTSGYPSVFTVSENVTDVPLFYPSTSSGSDSTYSCDGWDFGTSSPCLFVGGYYYQSLDLGLFCVSCSGTSYSSDFFGSRLLELPS